MKIKGILKKTALIMALALMVSGCGENSLKVIKQDESLDTFKLEIPTELKRENVNLLSFDTDYAVFTVERAISNPVEGAPNTETAEMVVYNVISEKVEIYKNLNLHEATVTDAMYIYDDVDHRHTLNYGGTEYFNDTVWFQSEQPSGSGNKCEINDKFENYGLDALRFFYKYDEPRVELISYNRGQYFLLQDGKWVMDSEPVTVFKTEFKFTVTDDNVLTVQHTESGKTAEIDFIEPDLLVYNENTAVYQSKEGGLYLLKAKDKTVNTYPLDVELAEGETVKSVKLSDSGALIMTERGNERNLYFYEVVVSD